MCFNINSIPNYFSLYPFSRFYYSKKENTNYFGCIIPFVCSAREKWSARIVLTPYCPNLICNSRFTPEIFPTITTFYYILTLSCTHPTILLNIYSKLKLCGSVLLSIPSFLMPLVSFY